jgi:hypothetical protein
LELNIRVTDFSNDLSLDLAQPILNFRVGHLEIGNQGLKRWLRFILIEVRVLKGLMILNNCFALRAEIKSLFLMRGRHLSCHAIGVGSVSNSTEVNRGKPSPRFDSERACLCFLL